MPMIGRYASKEYDCSKVVSLFVQNMTLSDNKELKLPKEIEDLLIINSNI